MMFRRVVQPEVEPETKLPSPVRLIIDPIEGPVVVVAGGMPVIMRVMAAKTLTTYRCEDIENAEWLDPKVTLWPTIVPSDLHGYRSVVLAPCAQFKPVELVAIVYGMAARGDGGRLYACWQDATRTLTVLTDTELRQALSSPWLRELRGDTRPTTSAIAGNLLDE